MKKEYTKPELTISLFTTEDVITASSGGMATPGVINIGTGSGGDIVIDFNDPTDP